MFFLQAEHVLPTWTEKLLSQVNYSRNFASMIYDKLAFADKKQEYLFFQDKKQLLTPSLLTEIMTQTQPLAEQELRMKATYLFNKAVISKRHSFASVFEAILMKNCEDLTLRKYKSFLAMALFDDEVPENVYQTLITTTKKNLFLVRNYYQLHKNYFKLKNYYATDTQLQLSSGFKTRFTVATAQSIIRKSLAILGTEYLEQLEKAWTPGIIDYFPGVHKQQGAYSSGGGNVPPIILMN